MASSGVDVVSCLRLVLEFQSSRIRRIEHRLAVAREELERELELKRTGCGARTRKTHARDTRKNELVLKHAAVVKQVRGKYRDAKKSSKPNRLPDGSPILSAASSKRMFAEGSAPQARGSVDSSFVMVEGEILRVRPGPAREYSVNAMFGCATNGK